MAIKNLSLQQMEQFYYIFITIIFNIILILFLLLPLDILIFVI